MSLCNTTEKQRFKEKKQRPYAIGVTITLMATIIIPEIHAIDDKMKKMLRMATGINNDDVKAASQKKEITLFDAYALAVQNNERMAIEGEKSIQAEERKLQAIEAFLPYVSIRANKALPDPDTKYISLARSAVSLYLRQPIITGLAEASQIKAAWSDRKIKEYQLNNNAALLLQDVGNVYYSVLLIEHDLKNNEELLGLYVKTVDELKRRVVIGRSKQSDILRTNTQIYSLQAKIKSLSTSLSHGKLLLGTLMGIDYEYSLSESININDPIYTQADLLKMAETRWDVKIAKEQVEYAKSSVMAAYGTHLPSIYLEGSYIFPNSQGSDYKVDQVKKNIQLGLSSNIGSSLISKYLNNGIPSKSRDYYFSFGVEFPILGGDVTFAKVRESNSIKRQMELGLSQIIRLARQNIIDSYNLWESSKIELEAFRKAQSSAEDNYRIVSGEYRNNLVTILDILTTLTVLQTARQDFERASLQLNFNRLNLGIATNEFYGDRIRALKL